MDGISTTIDEFSGEFRRFEKEKSDGFVVNFLRKLIQHRKHEKESFYARLQMETDAQREISARLKALEIKVKNETRRR